MTQTSDQHGEHLVDIARFRAMRAAATPRPVPTIAELVRLLRETDPDRLSREHA